jgi:hypothetical protein
MPNEVAGEGGVSSGAKARFNACFRDVVTRFDWREPLPGARGNVVCNVTSAPTWHRYPVARRLVTPGPVRR